MAGFTFYAAGPEIKKGNLKFPYSLMLSVMSNVVMKSRINPERKTTSAIFSYRCTAFLPLRIDKYDKILLVMNIRIATAVNSSITDVSLLVRSLSDVNTTKQSPSSVDEALSMCG